MKKTYGINVFYKLILNLFNIVVPLIIGVYTSRIFGPSLIGSVNYIQSYVNFFLIFGTFGVYIYGVREISRYHSDSEAINRLFSNLFSFGVLTNVVVFVLFIAFSVFSFQNDGILLMISMLLSTGFITNMFNVEWLNEGFENFNFITIKTVCVRTAYVVLLLCIVQSADNLYEYVGLMMLSNFVNNIISFIYIKRQVKFSIKYIDFKSIFLPLFMVVIIGNANVLYTQFDKMILGRNVSSESVGYYSTTQNIVSVISTLLQTSVYVAIPRISKLIYESVEKAVDFINYNALYFLLILFPAAFGLFVLSDETMLLYGGEQFAAGGNVLKMFSLYLIVIGYEAIMSNQIMYLFQKEKVMMAIFFFFGIVNIALKFLLDSFGVLGAESAIFTTCICNGLAVFSEYIYIRRVMKLKIRVFDKRVLKYFLLSLCFIGINYGVRYFAFSFIINMVVIISACVFFYFFALWITKDEIFYDMYEKMKAKVGRRIKSVMK